MTKTRIFFATDVHGSEKAFMKFVNAGKFYKADVLILGGDLTGKFIIPIVEQTDGSYLAHFLGSDIVAKTQEELQALEKNIRYNGYYPYRTNPKEKEELDADRAKVDKLFKRLMVEGLQRWIRIAEKRLRDTGIKVYITGGNDDPPDIEPVLRSSDYVINPEGAVVKIDDYHEMISTGYTNITPWKAPRDIPEEELAKKIEEMASQVKDMSNCIFNFHCPPYDSIIDAAPKLDKLRPTVGADGLIMIPVGSTAVRSSIEKHQPLLGLHGHIHESKGVFRIGQTLCLNPGSEYSEGILRGAIINLNEKRVKNYLIVKG